MKVEKAHFWDVSWQLLDMSSSSLCGWGEVLSQLVWNKCISAFWTVMIVLWETAGFVLSHTPWREWLPKWRVLPCAQGALAPAEVGYSASAACFCVSPTPQKPLCNGSTKGMGEGFLWILPCPYTWEKASINTVQTCLSCFPPVMWSSFYRRAPETVPVEGMLPGPSSKVEAMNSSIDVSLALWGSFRICGPMGWNIQFISGSRGG